MNFEQRHRPQTLNDIVYADVSVQQTLKEYASGKRTKHLLLYGPTGSGKSLSAKLILHDLMGVIEQMGFADPFHAKEFAAKHDNFDTVLNVWNMQNMYGANQGCVVFDELDQFTLPMQQRLTDYVRVRVEGNLCVENFEEVLDEVATVLSAQRVEVSLEVGRRE